jgi:hypothetical protein
MTVSMKEFLPPLADMAAKTEALTSQFRSFFAARGYAELLPVPVSQHADPTVLFVGSTINVLKDVLLSDNGFGTSVMLMQPALRSQNLRRMFDVDYVPAWTSRFVQVGVLTPPDAAGALLADSIAFMAELFAGGPELVLRASAQDGDLLQAVQGARCGQRIEIDGCPPASYRHRYGLPSVAGRNFNFSVRQQDGSLYDIGNYVVIEQQGVPLGAEFGFGMGTTLKCLHMLQHAIQAYPIAEHYSIRDAVDLKVADAIAVCSLLLVEGLRPGSSGQESVLKRYLRGIPRLLHDCPERLEPAVAAFARLYAGDSPGDDATPNSFHSYVHTCRAMTSEQKPDKEIATTLKNVWARDEIN